MIRGDLRDLARLEPISSVFGLDRGTPIDRWYIERYLGTHASDIRGRVAEVGDAHYTHRYGRETTESTVLDIDVGNRRASVIADLESGEGVPSASFDCFILTQVLMLTYNVHAAVRHVAASLKPGGVLLGSVSGISQISELDAAKTGEYWRFTAASVERILGEHFETTDVRAYGNVVTATAFLNGLAAEELTRKQLDYVDARYPLVITFRAARPSGPGSSA
jgi:SAM-dependent methyltransferase